MEIADDDVREDLMRLVSLVAGEASKIAVAFAQHQHIHETDAQALRLLRVADQTKSRLSTGELGAELGITSGATTFVVNRLARAGLVQRVRDPDDQRKVFLYFSNAGRALADELVAPVSQLSHAVMDQFTADELYVVQRFLAGTTAAMSQYRSSLMRP